MFKTPSGIALGVYSSETLDSINRFGGKLGVLELIGNNDLLSDELEKAGILVWGNLRPLILKKPHEGMSEEEFQIFQISHLHNEKQMNGLSPITNGKALIRGSVPGDWRSLVDVIPSPSTIATLDAINAEIRQILNRVKNDASGIKYYAEATGVSFNADDLSLGVVTAFDLPIITVTENPNNGDFYIDDFQGKLGGITGGSKIFTTTTTSEGIVKSSNGGNTLGEKGKVLRVKKMIEILTGYNILDPTIAYQFEFGQTYFGRLILFQIKELSRKIPASMDIRGSYPLRANKILFGGAYGYTLPIIPALMPGEWMETREIRNDTREGFAVFANNSSDASLKPHEIDPNMRGVFSGDSHAGSLVHNSFRYVQQVLQSGGIALLGEKIGGMMHDPAETNTALATLRTKNIRVERNEKGTIEIEFDGGKPSDDIEDVIQGLKRLTGNQAKLPFPKRRER